MKIETTLDEMKQDGNWQYALEEALRDNRGGMDSLIDIDNAPTETFGWDDIDEVLGSAVGENDGPSWIAAFRLKSRTVRIHRGWV